MEQDNNALLTQPLPAAASNKSGIRPVGWVMVFILVILLLIVIAQWLDSRRQISNIQQELARRLASTDQIVKDARLQAKQTQDETLTLQAKVILLEERLAEIKSQSVALQSMYEELSSSSDQRLLAEVEQAVTLAAQQLQFAGNVETALIALENADARLAHELQPQFMPIRRLLARDIERLKASPGADIASLSLKMETVVAVIDTLPLAFEQRPKRAKLSMSSTTLNASAVSNLPSMLSRAYWQTLAADVWQEMYQLMRIERLEQRDPALLAPEQSFFLRENLKLRLLNARLALLQRDGKTFREESMQAQLLLERYFDLRAPAVAAARKTLTALASTDVGFNLPSLNETLTAVRQRKASRERVSSR